MNWRKHFFEAGTLVVAAILCALTANALAARDKKLTVIPTFAAPPPSARAAQPDVAPPPPAATATTTTTIVPPTETAAEVRGATLKPTKTPATRQPDNPITTPAKPARVFTPHPDKAYVEIQHDDVAALHASGALFLDARRTSVYEQGHIAGARSFSVWEADIDDKVNKLYGERSSPSDQDKPIVIYCSGGDCEDSHMLAQKLWGIQFNNVYVYKDGFPDWQKRGGSIRTGGNS